MALITLLSVVYKVGYDFVSPVKTTTNEELERKGTFEKLTSRSLRRIPLHLFNMIQGKVMLSEATNKNVYL